MTTFTDYPNIFANGPGNIPDADLMMADLEHIRTFLNGENLDETNIKPLGIIAALIASGAVTADKIDPAVLAALGVSDGSNVRRGKSIIDPEETRSANTFDFLATQDRVQNVVVPANGLLRINYHALWQNSGSPGAQAAIFLKKGASDNQLTVPNVGSSAAQTVAAFQSNTSGNYGHLLSCPAGLAGHHTIVPASDPGTTGEALAMVAEAGTGGTTLAGAFKVILAGTNIVLLNQAPETGAYGGLNPETTAGGLYSWPSMIGGECVVRDLAAGTYDVGVKFLSATGTVTVKKRRLFVEAVGF